jgi:spore germination protein YaaH
MPSTEQTDALVHLIHSHCSEYDLDGIVLEHSVPHLLDAFTRKLKTALSTKLIILVVPPIKFMQSTSFTPSVLGKMLDCCVDYISLMTYDYSTPSIPGATAPLEWLEEAIIYLLNGGNSALAGRILMGINFYGYDYNLSKGNDMTPITGKEYLQVLERVKDGELRWDGWAHECSLDYHVDEHRHALWYPTLRVSFLLGMRGVVAERTVGFCTGKRCRCRHLGNRSRPRLLCILSHVA